EGEAVGAHGPHHALAMRREAREAAAAIRIARADRAGPGEGAARGLAVAAEAVAERTARALAVARVLGAGAVAADGLDTGLADDSAGGRTRGQRVDVDLEALAGCGGVVGNGQLAAARHRRAL